MFPHKLLGICELNRSNVPAKFVLFLLTFPVIAQLIGSLVKVLNSLQKRTISAHFLNNQEV